ncbi:5-methylcytosine restriction system specificity protein McrC [Effusibacillus pohliae]|uniref:5-methylcytosine restriction system specificity protein McrC n=1 Tax=Effusibacillus pohliae TaxID=232270 RepID=UPI00037E156C|nr:hypothetical protein [Effusibacillus pohliae]
MKKRKRQFRLLPRNEPPAGQSLIELSDTTQDHQIPASMLFRDYRARDPHPMEARLAHLFIKINRGIMRDFGVSADVKYDGQDVMISFQTQSHVGAIPLLSPTTGQADYGLVVRPRFEWMGIGSMLGVMNWRVVPSILNLPTLPQSDRKIPPWVLSSTILLRLRQLLENLDRQFITKEEDLTSPKGTIRWDTYVSNRVANARLLQVPCRFPELEENRELKAAIHYTLLKQWAGLESQRQAGAIVLRLLDLCQSLLQRVRHIPPKKPTGVYLDAWKTRRGHTDVFRNGLQAIHWTVDERGLAGIGELEGLSWMMPMETFFEAWVETIVSHLAKRYSGVVRTGRKRETIIPLRWDRPYLGSQKYLLPDLIYTRGNTTIIFDAKYKNHWEEMSVERWGNLDETLRERHRIDLLQVLAYSSISTAEKTICCMVYPCRRNTWESLKERNRLFHHAHIGAGEKTIVLALTAVPMDGQIDQIAESMQAMLKTVWTLNQ